MPTPKAVSHNKSSLIKRHHDLAKATEEEVRANPRAILNNADRGIQIAIVGSDGRVRSVMGLNGTRYLPNPDIDPLDEAIKMAMLKSAEKK